MVSLRAPMWYNLCHYKQTTQYDELFEFIQNARKDQWACAYSELRFVGGDEEILKLGQAILPVGAREHLQVIVDVVVATEREREEGSINKLLHLLSSDGLANPLLVLLEHIQLIVRTQYFDLYFLNPKKKQHRKAFSSRKHMAWASNHKDGKAESSSV